VDIPEPGSLRLPSRHRSAVSMPARALIAIAMLAIGAGLVLRGSALDRTLFAAANAWGPVAPVLWSALSVAGLGASAFLLAGLAGPRRPEALAAILLSVVLGGLAIHLCKLAFGAPRPLAVLADGAVYLIGIPLRANAMPSGHAAMGFCAAALLMCWRPRRAIGLGLLAGSAAVLIGWARIAVGAHWPSDVLAGAGLGLATGAALAGTGRGRRAVLWLAALLGGRVASRATAAALVASACAMWVAERDYPLAGWMHGVLALAGLLGAAAWWRAHPGPAPARGAPRPPTWPAAAS
jgi:undecaprenyl-diphosphatase